MSTGLWEFPHVLRIAHIQGGVFVESITKTRLKEIAKSKGIPMSQALKEVGLNPGFITDIGRKGDIPSSDKLMKLADYFDVSTDYLLGRTDKPEVNK